MERLNITEVETRFGYRSFEIWEGDLTRIAERVDALAVSALPSNYDLVPGTVVAALDQNLGISVGALAQAKELDYRSVLDCWVSRKLEHGPFGRIVCVETVRGRAGIQSTLENVFVFLSLLEAKGIEIETFLMPMLAAGNQQFEAKQVIGILVPSAIRHLERSFALRRIAFVAYRKAEAELLSRQMDELLGRARVLATSGPIEEGLRKELDVAFSRVAGLPGDQQPPNLSELRRLILSPESRALEIGISGRRLVEFMAARLLAKKVGGDLMTDIEALAATHVAPWIRSYMHTLRVIGNEQAHQRNADARHPPHVTDRDVTACLFCIQRLLDFWLTRPS
jgi:O-acetyl-ADP-ribose deacetylase (regulator of RNase III)